MKREFMRLRDNVKVDAVSYLKEKLLETPDAEIYIGCDSQTHGRETTYAVVIVLHRAGQGGHVLYFKEKIPAIREIAQRLWREVETSVEVADYLLENGVKRAKYIDIDVNPDKKYKSNMLLTSAIGLVNWKGYEGRTKPTAFCASYCADKICK